MRASPVLTLIGVVAVASTASAHSWSEASLIGTVVPGTVKCKDGECAATVRVERVVGRTGAFGDVDVAFKKSTALDDRERGAPWPDLETGLLRIGGARVRLFGLFDHFDDRYVLFGTWRAVRMRAVPPAGPRAALFPACGSPPWSQTTLERCAAAGPRARRVTVNATLESDAMGGELDLESVSLEDKGIALEPPEPLDTVFVPTGTRFVNPRSPRLLLKELRAGDRISIDAAYELPLAQKAKEPGWRCADASCSPRFVVNAITLVSVTTGAGP